jgi:hypothetical protein
MKLAVLSPTLAQTLGMPKPTVNVLAMTLRKAGLISSGGRGRGGAEMTPTDVTNLLLAAMGGGHAKDAPEVVRRLREATSQQSAPGPKGPPPILPDLPLLSAVHTLGAVLDAIFLNYAAEGELIEQGAGLPITNMRFAVTFPHRLSYQAELWIDTGDDTWTLRYHRNYPDFDLAPKAHWNEIARSLLDGQGDLAFKATITSNTFYALSEALGDSARRRAAEQLQAALCRS